MAIIVATPPQVETRSWTHPRTGENRRYVQNWKEIIEFEVGYSNAGNVTYSTLKGEKVAHARAASLLNVKVWLDSQNNIHVDHLSGKGATLISAERIIADIAEALNPPSLTKKAEEKAAQWAEKIADLCKKAIGTLEVADSLEENPQITQPCVDDARERAVKTAEKAEEMLRELEELSERWITESVKESCEKAREAVKSMREGLPQAEADVEESTEDALEPEDNAAEKAAHDTFWGLKKQAYGHVDVAKKALDEAKSTFDDATARRATESAAAAFDAATKECEGMKQATAEYPQPNAGFILSILENELAFIKVGIRQIRAELPEAQDPAAEAEEKDFWALYDQASQTVESAGEDSDTAAEMAEKGDMESAQAMVESSSAKIAGTKTLRDEMIAALGHEPGTRSNRQHYVHQINYTMAKIVEELEAVRNQIAKAPTAEMVEEPTEEADQDSVLNDLLTSENEQGSNLTFDEASREVSKAVQKDIEEKFDRGINSAKNLRAASATVDADNIMKRLEKLITGYPVENEREQRQYDYFTEEIKTMDHIKPRQKGDIVQTLFGVKEAEAVNELQAMYKDAVRLLDDAEVLLETKPVNPKTIVELLDAAKTIYNQVISSIESINPGMLGAKRTLDNLLADCYKLRVRRDHIEEKTPIFTLAQAHEVMTNGRREMVENLNLVLDCLSEKDLLRAKTFRIEAHEYLEMMHNAMRIIEEAGSLSPEEYMAMQKRMQSGETLYRGIEDRIRRWEMHQGLHHMDDSWRWIPCPRAAERGEIQEIATNRKPDSGIEVTLTVPETNLNATAVHMTIITRDEKMNPVKPTYDSRSESDWDTMNDLLSNYNNNPVSWQNVAKDWVEMLKQWL